MQCVDSVDCNYSWQINKLRIDVMIFLRIISTNHHVEWHNSDRRQLAVLHANSLLWYCIKPIFAYINKFVVLFSEVRDSKVTVMYERFGNIESMSVFLNSVKIAKIYWKKARTVKVSLVSTVHDVVSHELSVRTISTGQFGVNLV